MPDETSNNGDVLGTSVSVNASDAVSALQAQQAASNAGAQLPPDASAAGSSGTIPPPPPTAGATGSPYDDPDYIQAGKTASAREADAYYAQFQTQRVNMRTHAKMRDEMDARRTQIIFDAQESYLRDNGSSPLDLKAYRQYQTQALVEGGAARPAEADAFHLNEFTSQFPEEQPGIFERTGGAWSWGFGAMGTASAIGRAMTPMVAGEQYLPGQVGQQVASSTLPLAGSVIGASIGFAAGGPMGSMAGQFIGGAIGQVGGGIWDSYYEGHNAAPYRAGQQLGAGRGGSQAVDDFTKAIQNATGATKEVADIMVQLGRTMPLSPGAATGIGSLQQTLGYAAPDVIQGIATGLQSSPALFPLLQQFGQKGTLSASQYQSGAQYFATMGDYSTAKNFEAGYEATVHPAAAPTPGALRPSVNQFAQILQFGWDELKYPFSSDTASAGKDIDRDVNAWANPPTPPTPQTGSAGATGSVAFAGTTHLSINDIQAKAPDIATLTAQSEAAQFDILRYGTSTALGLGSAKLSELQGGGSAALSNVLKGLAGTEAQYDKSSDAQIARWSAIASTPGVDPTVALAAAQNANQARIQQQDYHIGIAGGQHDAVTMGIQERQSAFGATGASQAYSITRAIIGGASYASQEGAQSAFVGTERSRAADLAASAQNGLLSPAEKSQLTQQSSSALMAAAQQEYNNKLGRYSEAEQGVSVTQAQASYAVTQARLTGGPAELQSAYGQSVQGFADQIRQLSGELSKGGLSLEDFRTKTTQLTQAQTGLAEAQYQAQTAYADSNIAIGGYRASAASSRYGVDVARYGTGAQSSADLQAEVASLKQNAADARTAASGFAKGTDPYEKYMSQAQGFDAQAFDVQQQTALMFHVAPGQEAAELRTQGALGRASRSFLEPGNIQTERLEAFAQINQDLAAFDKQIQAFTAKNGPLTDAQQVTVESQRQDLLNKRADIADQADRTYFDRLPAMTVGGTSFEQRYLPSPSQVAANLEWRGYGTLAARNFGFFNDSTFHGVEGTDGASLLDAGRSLTGIFPGNESLRALAMKESPHSGSFTSGAPSDASVLADLLKGGLVISGSIKVDSSGNGTLSNAKLQAVRAASRMSQTTQTRALLPGLGG